MFGNKQIKYHKQIKCTIHALPSMEANAFCNDGFVQIDLTTDLQMVFTFKFVPHIKKIRALRARFNIVFTLKYEDSHFQLEKS